MESGTRITSTEDDVAMSDADFARALRQQIQLVGPEFAKQRRFCKQVTDGSAAQAIHLPGLGMLIRRTLQGSRFRVPPGTWPHFVCFAFHDVSSQARAAADRKAGNGRGSTLTPFKSSSNRSCPVQELISVDGFRWYPHWAALSGTR